MKTAISISDETFHEAELIAKEMGISRSELYGKALQKFLKETREQKLIDELNTFYATEDNRDSGFEKIQSHSLKKQDQHETW
jgi:metal-responsive CopG/Arc/MetJ family transcriptional regulator